jgi:hypothetical protein
MFLEVLPDMFVPFVYSVKVKRAVDQVNFEYSGYLNQKVLQDFVIKLKYKKITEATDSK